MQDLRCVSEEDLGTFSKELALKGLLKTLREPPYTVRVPDARQRPLGSDMSVNEAMEILYSGPDRIAYWARKLLHYGIIFSLNDILYIIIII